jgi:TonB family protein
MSRQTSVPMEVSRPMTMSPEGSAASDKPLFGDSLLDPTVGERKSRTWTALVSVVLQCFLIGLLLLLPLWFTEALPKQQLLTFLEAPHPPPPPPPPATAAPIQSDVVLTAIIDKQGKVQHLHVRSGHPLLAPAAIATDEQWHYKPFLLNGKPVGVETRITVHFRMQNS